jgi:hypothetical protein
VNKAVAKAIASVAFMGVAGIGVSACGNQPVDSGYEYVWDHGHYTYVPYDYYYSHRSYYNHTGHPVRKYSSSYVTKHHVTVVHKTTTTVHSNGKRTTTKHSTIKRSTTRSRRR